MKKNLVLFAAFVACAAISCSKAVEPVKENNEPAQQEETTPTHGMRTVTITASIDDATKTSYAADGTFSWTAGDKISVLGDDDNFYTFIAKSTASSSVFTGTLPDGVSLGSRAYFPADAGHTTTQFNIPKEKNLVGNPSADIPMIGTKGEGDSFSFTHCAGAAQLTITNIPDGIESVQISIVNASLSLSGPFTIKEDGGGHYYWEPLGKTDDRDTFIRKVTVASNSAQVYLPYSCDSSYGNLWAASTISVIGYDALETSTTLLTGKTMGALGTFTRAHIKPLTPLILSNLSRVNWEDAGVVTSNLNPSDSRKCLTELKVIADSYYMYVRLKGPEDISDYVGNYLDVYLSDGQLGGGHYSLADNNKYWSTEGDIVYREEHKGTITSSSLSMTINSKSVETKTENDGTTIYWYLALPRSAHSLLSSTGTVYVGFVLWNGWDVTGVIPTKYSSMLSVSLP